MCDCLLTFQALIRDLNHLCAFFFLESCKQDIKRTVKLRRNELLEYIPSQNSSFELLTYQGGVFSGFSCLGPAITTNPLVHEVKRHS